MLEVTHRIIGNYNGLQPEEQIAALYALGGFLLLVLLTVRAARLAFGPRAIAISGGERTASLRATGTANTQEPLADPVEAELAAAYDQDYAAWVIAQTGADSLEEATAFAERWRRHWEAETCPSDLDRARHAAAHAIAAHHLGRTVTHATIESSGERGGYCISHGPIPHETPADHAYTLMSVFLAAHQNDLLHHCHLGSTRSDVLEAQTLAASIIATGMRPDGFHDPITTDHLIRAAASRALAILDERAAEHKKIAGALLEHRTLGPRHLNRLLGRQPAPALRND